LGLTRSWLNEARTIAESARVAALVLLTQCYAIVCRTAKVTGALLLRRNAGVRMVVFVIMNMETTNSIRVRASRFFSDRYAYRAQPNYSSELVAFGIIVLIAIWPIILLANAMAAAAR